VQKSVTANLRFDAQACNHWLLAVFRPMGADTLCPTKLHFLAVAVAKLKAHPVLPGEIARTLVLPANLVSANTLLTVFLRCGII
jgi:hypothetical protein